MSIYSLTGTTVEAPSVVTSPMDTTSGLKVYKNLFLAFESDTMVLFMVWLITLDSCSWS